MLKKRLATAHPERSLTTMSDAGWDTLCAPRVEPNVTWTVAADVPSHDKNGIELRLDRVADNTPPGAFTRKAMIRYTNSRFASQMSGARGPGSQIWLEDSSVKVTDAGFPKGVYNGPAVGGTSVVASRTHIEGPIDGTWAGDSRPLDGNPTSVDHCDYKGKGFGQMQGYMLAPGNWGKPADQIIVGEAGTIGRRFYTEAEQRESLLSLGSFNQGDIIPAGKYFSAGGRFYAVTQAGPMPVQAAGNASYASDMLAFITAQAWPGRGPDGSTADRTAVFNLLTKGADGVYRDQSGAAVSAQPFTAQSGSTLQLVSLGAYLHADGAQNIRPGWYGWRQSRFRGWANSTFLDQTNIPFGSMTAPDMLDYRVDSTGRPNLPLGGTFNPDYYGIKHVGLIMEPLSNQWAYVNVAGGNADPIWTNFFPGMYTRDLNAPNWYVNPVNKQYVSPPWGVSFIECQFLDRVNNHTTNWGTQVQPTMTPGAYPGAVWTADNTSAQHPITKQRGDYAVFVKYDQQRRDAVARQFNADGSINFAVLEARCQAGIQANRCDARTWIEWRDNQNARGETILPAVRAGFGGFGSDGYLLPTVL